MGEPVKDTFYKIRHRASGRHSKGGRTPAFSKNGKIWHNPEELKLHLNQVDQGAYVTCELVEFTREVIETQQVRSFNLLLIPTNQIKREMAVKRNERQETREKRERREIYELLKKEFKE